MLGLVLKGFWNGLNAVSYAIASLFVKEPEKLAKWILAGIVFGALLAILLFVKWLFYDPVSQNEIDANNARDNAISQQANANVQGEEVEKARANVTAAEKTAVNASREREKAQKERDKAVKKDSKDADAANVEDRFCRKFSNDSSCTEWRKKNGID